MLLLTSWLLQVVLETEFDNAAALSLYESLGFIREKRLFRFYLNGKDAFRLVLVVTPIRQDDKALESDPDSPLMENTPLQDAKMLRPMPLLPAPVQWFQVSPSDEYDSDDDVSSR